MLCFGGKYFYPEKCSEVKNRKTSAYLSVEPFSDVLFTLRNMPYLTSIERINILGNVHNSDFFFEWLHLCGLINDTFQWLDYDYLSVYILSNEHL